MPSILITGASRGFGRELLDVYASSQWTLFPLVRDPQVAEQLANQYAPRCFPIVGDVSCDSIGNVITDVLTKQNASLDVLINNAGHIVKNRGILGVSTRDLIEHFDVHVAGVWRCTVAALPFLKKATKPVVVNITSRFGSIGRIARRKSDFVYGYNIAKAAQNMLTACMARDLGRDGIKVIAVHPGQLKTSAAALDADTDPHVAAEKLDDFISHLDSSTECRMYDLMKGEYIEW
ncbi:short-chain dehydrogenase [candidate division GN15 bacterium]|uniref:Short-chain dehydrogenase n=1 Tax=candidate division GN15 bacterium TaxID=2072418 RepID=A0A855X4B5_9BACT|nr:MAG: short-chain dehydrogenase [candidate division GN15 bacterium]